MEFRKCSWHVPSISTKNARRIVAVEAAGCSAPTIHQIRGLDLAAASQSVYHVSWARHCSRPSRVVSETPYLGTGGAMPGFEVRPEKEEIAAAIDVGMMGKARMVEQ